MKRRSFYRIMQTVVVILAVLLVAVLIMSGMTRNMIYSSRSKGDYIVIEEVSSEIREAPDAPTGVVHEYRFALDEIGHASTLAFFVIHHHVEVYVGEECVYSLTSSGGSIRTPSGVWPMIPLYETDQGKEVRVVLSPVYDNYQEETPEFLLGSELAIYRTYLMQALPEWILSLSVVLAGLFLLFIGIYSSIRRDSEFRIYALSLLALSAGLWRITYESFSYLLLENQTVLIYNISVIALMLVAVAMINIVDVRENKKASGVIRYTTLCYCVLGIGQLLLQLTGVLDLRQMLKMTHVTLMISAVVISIRSSYDWFGHTRKDGKFPLHNHSWMLGVGVIIDLLLYYFSKSSGSMLFSLGAILCYSILEGIHLLTSYVHQEHALKEMEAQLTLSRTTAMMGQIRSHFVFNTLNAISGMCKYDPEMADEMVVRFARYLRNNIDIMEDDKPIRFSTELQRLEDYVILEQVRFGDKIEFMTDIEVDQFMIPPLIVQPVVENAIKHGLIKKSTGGTIVLRTRQVGDHIEIIVEDDGVGFDMQELDKKDSVGLGNIRFRLHHLVQGALDVESKVGCGTKVTIRIPKKEAFVCM